MVFMRPSPSPSRGRPGWGWVVLVRWGFGRCRGGWETHPHPTLPLKGRAFRRLLGGLELGGPVLLDLADQLRRQRHVVEFGGLLPAARQRPGEELAGPRAALLGGGLVVHRAGVGGGE